MLVVVDSTRKVSTLRAFMSEHKVISVEFPLYNRFRRGKAKLDVWPVLRPVAAEIKLLQKQAHGQDVLGIFDDSDYGRVQARDLVEALSDLNNAVTLKFVRAYTPQAIDAAELVYEAPSDCDIKYVINRLVSDRITTELERYAGEDGDLACTWQQAVLLHSIRCAATVPEAMDKYVDAHGRVYTGKFDADAPATVRTYIATFRPVRKSILDLVDAGIDIEDVQPGLDKLRSSGHVAVGETKITADLFEGVIDSVLAHADSLQLEGFVPDSESSGFFVTDFERDSARLPDADYVKALHRLIKTETLLGCCGPLRGNMVVANVRGLETSYVHPERQSWLPLSIPVSDYPPDTPEPDQVRDALLADGASNRHLTNTAAGCRMTARDVWLATRWLLLKKLAVRRDGFWYLTSRGCLVLHILDLVFPLVTTASIADKIDALVEQHHKETNNTTEIRRLETMSAVKTLLIDNIHDVNPNDLWEQLAGDDEVNVSPHAAWVVSAGTTQGLYFNAATGDFEPVDTGVSVFDPCPCGAARFVNTALSPTYETVVECPACGLVRPLIGILEKEP